MPERVEGEQYKKKYTDLLKELEKFEISEDDFIWHLYNLEEQIKQEISATGILPEYAYVMVIKEVLPYEYQDNTFLELICTFKPKKENRDDITVVGPFLDDLRSKDGDLIIYDVDDLSDTFIPESMLVPISGNAVVNITTGKYSSRVDWEERAV